LTNNSTNITNIIPKKQNNNRIETIKLILKSLIKQYSLEKIINYLIIKDDSNHELKSILDFLINEESKLKIINLLINLNENENNEPPELIENIGKRNMIENEDENIDSIRIEDDEKENDNTNTNSNTNTNTNSHINMEMSKNMNLNEIRNEQKNELIELNENEHENENSNHLIYNKINEENTSIIIESDDSISISITSQDEKLIKEHSLERHRNYIKERSNMRRRKLSPMSVNNNQFRAGHLSPPKNRGNNIHLNKFMEKKRKVRFYKKLKYYYSFENNRYYKYVIRNLHEGIANFECVDDKCGAKGVYNVDTKKFNLICTHNILYLDHVNIKHMNTMDRKYYERIKDRQLKGIEVYAKFRI